MSPKKTVPKVTPAEEPPAINNRRNTSVNKCPTCGGLLTVISSRKTGKTTGAFCPTCKRCPFTARPKKKRAPRKKKANTEEHE